MFSFLYTDINKKNYNFNVLLIHFQTSPENLKSKYS